MDNLAPKPSTISEAYKLSQIKQEASGPMALNKSRVKLAAAKCCFGRMVREKFICGLQSETLRAQAFSKAIARDNSETGADGM